MALGIIYNIQEFESNSWISLHQDPFDSDVKKSADFSRQILICPTCFSNNLGANQKVPQFLSEESTATSDKTLLQLFMNQSEIFKS